jgi:hypothetical protein
MAKTKKLPDWELEIATTEFRQSVTAEFIATFMFLFCTIGCVVFTQDGGITTARQLEVSLVFGGMITILVFIMGGISGAALVAATRARDVRKPLSDPRAPPSLPFAHPPQAATSTRPSLLRLC